MEHIFESNILWDGPITLLLTLQWSTNGCLQLCTCYLSPEYNGGHVCLTMVHQARLNKRALLLLLFFNQRLRDYFTMLNKLHFLSTFLVLLSFLLIRLYFRFLLSTSGKTALEFLTKL